MIRRTNLALMETVLAERRREHAPQHPLAEYVRDWTHAHTLQAPQPTRSEASFAISLSGRED